MSNEGDAQETSAQFETEVVAEMIEENDLYNSRHTRAAGKKQWWSLNAVADSNANVHMTPG